MNNDKFTIAITACFDQFIHINWAKLVPDYIKLVDPLSNHNVIVVVNAPWSGHTHLIKNKPLIIFQMEPHMELRQDLWFDWSNPWLFNPIYVFDHSLYQGNAMEWHLPFTIEQLKNIKFDKQKLISIILTSKNWDPGHKLRLDLNQKLTGFVDLYGTITNGIALPVGDKSLGLFDYKYHIAVENHTIDNYVSEKMFDGILSECCVFWHGGKQNIVNEKCFVRLFDSNVKNVNLIKLCIQFDVYSKLKNKIKDEKHRLLNEYNIGTRVQRALTVAT